MAAEALARKIQEAREKLRALTEEELATRTGFVPCSEGFSFNLVGVPHLLSWPDLCVLDAFAKESSEEVQALVLDYVLFGDGSKPAGRWLSFAELPHGTFYAQAFQRYSGDELVRRLNGDRRAFTRGAERLGGKPLDFGDAAYSFFALPHIPLAVVWWDGEEEIPPKATVLFDAVAPKYLPPEGLAILGRMLCRRIAKAAEEG